MKTPKKKPKQQKQPKWGRLNISPNRFIRDAKQVEANAVAALPHLVHAGFITPEQAYRMLSKRGLL